MNARRVAPRLLAGVLTFAVVATGSASAQELSVERWTIAGGGDVYTESVEGQWTLSGTLGDWAASGPQQGGNWTLTGGFWAGSAVAGEGTAIFQDGFEAD
jgi:hypothetical protein